MTMPERDSEGWREVAECVGWVAIEVARLEYALTSLTVRLTRSGLTYSIVVGQGWATTRETFRVLIAEWMGTEQFPHQTPDDMRKLGEIRANVKRAHDLMSARNRAIHSLWSEPVEGSHDTLLLRRWGRSVGGVWTTAELRTLRADLTQATDALLEAADYVRELDERLRR